MPFFFSTECDVYPEVLVESPSIDLRLLLKSSLTIWKYRVLESDNFEETREILSERKPALILLDCESRFEADLIKIRTLRKSHISSRIPIIALSGHIEQNDQDLMYRAGANDHLAKPVDFERLAFLVDDNIKRHYQFKSSTGGLL